jgi:hypothetical protein
VWFVTNFAKGVHEDEEIERALDILEMLLNHRSDVDGVFDKIRRFLLEHVLFSKGGKRLLSLVVKEEGDSGKSYKVYRHVEKTLAESRHKS